MTGERRGTRELRREPGSPLWQQLLELLRQRLDNDEFTAGFPGELALVEEYQVSRHTVRAAMQVLREEGLVIAGRGRPPRQAEPVEIARRLGALYSLYESVRGLGLEQRSVIRCLEVQRDAVVAARLGLGEDTPLVHLERLRLAGDEPLALDRVWLPKVLAAPLLDADFSRTSLYELYARLCGVVLTDGREQILPVLPTPAEHRLLGGPRDTAAFSIQRLGQAKGRPVEWRHTLVRGDRFALTTAPAGTGGYRLELLSPTRGGDARS
ncbi:MAG: GntR family transcriptional regulator [Pseudonocardia sp.]|nr:GntR family transcriptional regulator [Pseudonocardia sp.]